MKEKEEKPLHNVFKVPGQLLRTLIIVKPEKLTFY